MQPILSLYLFDGRSTSVRLVALISTSNSWALHGNNRKKIKPNMTMCGATSSSTFLSLPALTIISTAFFDHSLRTENHFPQRPHSELGL